MRKSAADGSLSSSRRACQEDSALRFETEFRCQFAILKRQGDLGFELLDQVVDAFEVVPSYGLNLVDFDVAHQVVGVQVVQKARRVGAWFVRKPVFGPSWC